MCVLLTGEYKIDGVLKDSICKVQIVVRTAAADEAVIGISCSKSADDLTSPVLSGITVNVLEKGEGSKRTEKKKLTKEEKGETTG